MLLEQRPYLQAMSAEQQRQLAEELWQAADGAEEVEVDPAIVELLESRMAAFKAGTMEASSWDEVRRRVFQSNGA